MASDLKISELTTYTTPIATDLLPIVDVTNSITKRIAFSLTGAARYRQTEIDFGTIPIYEKEFTIVDTDISAASNIIAQLAYVAPTEKELDELEFDNLDFRCAPGAGSFTLYVRSLEGLVADKFKVNYSFNIV